MVARAQPTELRSPDWPEGWLRLVTAVARRPGVTAAALGDGRVIAAKLRAMQQAGLVVASRHLPARWHVTSVGESERRRIVLLLARRRVQARLARCRTRQEVAERLAGSSADELLTPGARQLCQSGTVSCALSFRGLFQRFERQLGQEALVAVSEHGAWPANQTMTFIGTIQAVERELLSIDIDHLDDLDLVMTVRFATGGFIHLARRHFKGACETAIGDLIIRQGSQEIEVWLGL